MKMRVVSTFEIVFMDWLNIAFLSLAIACAPAKADVWSFEKMQKFTGYSYWGSESSPLSSKQKEATRSYQAAPFINSSLRKTLPLEKNNRQTVHYLDKSMLLIKFPTDLTLFRGVDLGFRNGEIYKVGEEFVDNTYTSTTINPSVAQNIAKTAIYILYSSRDFDALWIGGNGLNSYQEEILLPRGARFKVMNSKVRNDTYVQLVQICGYICNDVVLNSDANLIFSNF